MQDILKIMAGVFLGEFVWGLVLFTFLYFLIRSIIRNFKRRIFNSGFHISIGGHGVFKGAEKKLDVSARDFVRYSGKVVNSTINRMRN